MNFTPSIGHPQIYKVNIDSIKTLTDALEVIKAFEMTIISRGGLSDKYKNLKDKGLLIEK